MPLWQQELPWILVVDMSNDLMRLTFRTGLAGRYIDLAAMLAWPKVMSCLGMPGCVSRKTISTSLTSMDRQWEHWARWVRNGQGWASRNHGRNG